MDRVIVTTLPEFPDEECVHVFTPVDNGSRFYKQRTDRNIGFITQQDQKVLKDTVIGIAGCGGMGGQLACNLLRLGIGELRLADPEVFDVSNINRQFAATIGTIGKNKAFETARKLREIADDTLIEAYPMGITDRSVYDFVSGCDLVIDEIELLEFEAPIILHRAARACGTPILGCNTAGFGSHLFMFTKESMSFEEAFALSREEARRIDEARRNDTLTQSEKEELVDKLILMVAPETQIHNPKEFSAVRQRLLLEGRASIIATNPSFATGFLGDHIVLFLTDSLSGHEDGVSIPPMPGYLYIDARRVKGKVVDKQWW